MRGEDNANQSFYTLQKILQYPEPYGYRINTPRTKLKIAPFLERIAQINDTDKSLPKKQHHTAKRIKEEWHYGKSTQVKKAVREIRRIKVWISYFPGKNWKYRYLATKQRIGPQYCIGGIRITKPPSTRNRFLGTFLIHLPSV